MELLKKRLGSTIRELRKQQQLTQEQLAEESGISTDFISRVERGKNIPSLERIDAIAMALDVTLAEFFLHIDSSDNNSGSMHKKRHKQQELLHNKPEHNGSIYRCVMTEG